MLLGRFWGVSGGVSYSSSLTTPPPPILSTLYFILKMKKEKSYHIIYRYGENLLFIFQPFVIRTDSHLVGICWVTMMMMAIMMMLIMVMIMGR